jgi:hypothetical protein
VTKWIIAHSSFANPKKILILDPDGNLKGAYTYGIIQDYDRFWRNLLLGYDSSISTYFALVQTRSASNNGF